MTKKRLLLRLILTAVIVGAAFACYVYFTSPSRYINKANSELIVPGMAKDAVEAILGPAGDLASVVFVDDAGAMTLLEMMFLMNQRGEARKTDLWISNVGMIVVAFDNDSVISTTFVQLTTDYPATLRKWLRLN